MGAVPRREPALEDLEDPVVQEIHESIAANEAMAGIFASDAEDHFTADLLAAGARPLGTTSPLELSRALQTRLAEVRGVEGGEAASAPQSLTHRLRMNVEAMHVELAELLMELPWKEWKSYPEDFYGPNRLAAIKEEVIDLYFFLNNMFLALGMDDEQIRGLYELKFKKNMERQLDGGAYR